MLVFTWQMAEELAAGHMRDLGFGDAKRTPVGVDAGLDVIATGAVAQVKSWNAAIGAPEIQRLRGAAHSIQNVLFYSRSGYTSAAKHAADNSGVALFEFTPQNEVAPANRVADDLLRDIPRVGARSELYNRVFAVPLFTGIWIVVFELLDSVDIREADEGDRWLLSELEPHFPDDEEVVQIRQRAERASALRSGWERTGHDFVRAYLPALRALRDRAVHSRATLAAAEAIVDDSTRAMALAEPTDDAQQICVEYAQFRSAVDAEFPEVVFKAQDMRGLWAANSLNDPDAEAIARFFSSPEGSNI